MSDLVQSTTDTNFDADVLQSNTPVLVDFWAEWCGPCKAIAPVLEAAAKAYEGRVKILKLNVDENPEMATKYGIRSIPNLILFKGGDVAASKMGSMTQSELSAFLDENS